MFRDPIIEEVRRIRHQIEAEFEHNPQKYYEHIQKVQDEYRNRLVRFKPKPALKKQKAAA